MQDQVVSALAELFSRYQRLAGLPLIDYDPEFSSPAELLPAQQGRVGWRPWLKPEADAFDNVAHALDMQVHPDLSALFGRYYAGHVPGCFKGLFLTLLQPWNERDFARLQENQIAHQLMMTKLKLPASWFIATTANEQQLVTLANDSGEVWLEQLGKGRIGVLAPSLVQFLHRLEPGEKALAQRR